MGLREREKGKGSTECRLRIMKGRGCVYCYRKKIQNCVRERKGAVLVRKYQVWRVAKQRCKSGNFFRGTSGDLVFSPATTAPKFMCTYLYWRNRILLSLPISVTGIMLHRHIQQSRIVRVMQVNTDGASMSRTSKH